jgi:FkbM family methyltransferase
MQVGGGRRYVAGVQNKQHARPTAATSIADLMPLAIKAFRSKDVRRAERLCREILAAAPGQVQAMEMLAEVLAFTNRPAEAIPLFQQIVQTLDGALASMSISHGLGLLRKLGWQPSGILDVGAYHGEWSRMANYIYPEAFILMVEAQPQLEPVLKALAATQPGKFAVRRAVLGPERRDAVDFFQMNVPITTGSSLYEEQTRFARSVLKLPMLRLDDVVAELGGQRFQLLKLDVQGAELDVIEGASATLAGIEVLVVELSLVEYNKGAPLIADMTAALKDRGFLMFDIYPMSRNRAGTLLQVDAIFLRRDSAQWAKPPFF